MARSMSLFSFPVSFFILSELRASLSTWIVAPTAFRFAGDDRFATSAGLPLTRTETRAFELISSFLATRLLLCTSAIWRSYKSHLTLNHPLGKLSSLMPHERLFPSSFLLIPTFLCFFSLPFFSFPRLRTPQLVIFEFSS